MKNIAKTIILIFLISIAYFIVTQGILYITFSFAAKNMNPFYWSEPIRVFFGVLSICNLIFYIGNIFEITANELK